MMTWGKCSRRLELPVAIFFLLVSVAFASHSLLLLLRLWTIRDGLIQRDICGFQILVHQERRRVQRITDVIKARRRSIHRQQVPQARIDTEQIAHRVLILRPIQSA